MAALFDLFQKAPELGSLIDPMAATQGDLISAQWDELAAKLDLALAVKNGAPETEASLATAEARVSALGMLHASRILNKRYHLVITNVPYLGQLKFSDLLRDFIISRFEIGRSDLALAFMLRCLELATPGGHVAIVLPQGWLMGSLNRALYLGERFSADVGAIVPKNPNHLGAIVAFAFSDGFLSLVRSIYQKPEVPPSYLVNIPFDLEHWKAAAAERYPNGLPQPYSDDATQWIFHGHPQPATDPLQVAVARLLGYRWPAEQPSPALTTTT